MKNIRIAGIFIILFLWLGCAKEPNEATNLPDTVALGASVVYLNGELVPNYRASFNYSTKGKDVFNYAFYDSVELKVNTLGFSWLPLSTGNYGLHEERILYVKALTSFSQIVSEDLDGYSYELEDPEDGFFEVQTLDTVQRIAQGRFRAKFKRTSKNGNRNLGLPKRILLQGVFHEHYTVE